MDAQDGYAATRQFTVSIGDGYGTTICTFETLPLVPLKCTGIRKGKGSRDTTRIHVLLGLEEQKCACQGLSF